MFGRSDYRSLFDFPSGAGDLRARARVGPGDAGRTARRTCGRMSKLVGGQRADAARAKTGSSASGGSGVLKISAVLTGLAAAGLAAYFLVYRSPGPKPSSIEDLGLSRGPSAASPPYFAQAGDASDTVSVGPAARLPVGVYVAGAVNAPGVYFFGEGRRVVDALEAAGGPTGEADLDKLNLAAPLQDGVHIYVPRKGEEPSVGRGSTSSGAPGAEGFASSSGKEGTSLRVNVNTAPPSELEKLPGIGPALAERMVEERTRNGPFRGLQDLRRVSGIGDAKIAQMAPFVVF